MVKPNYAAMLVDGVVGVDSRSYGPVLFDGSAVASACETLITIVYVVERGPSLLSSVSLI